MLIGLDFDNTIADYDEAFAEVAREWGLIEPDFMGSKKQVRDAIRLLPDGELAWQRLQGRMYGHYMPRARPMAGAIDFMRRAKAAGAELAVVSHKTRYGHFDPDRIDLRAAALAWMEGQGLFDGLLSRTRVFFESTREEKVARIAAIGCDLFVDDLAEVFTEPGFPPSVRAILFAAGYESLPQGPFTIARNFAAVTDLTLAGEVEATQVAERLLGRRVDRIEANPGGGNNRLYCIEARGERFALKSYPGLADDPRDRLGAEFAALAFLGRRGEVATPPALAAERAANFALLGWIEGVKVDRACAADIDAALAFAERLRDYVRHDEADALPLASEACLSGAEVMAQVRRRQVRLAEIAPDRPDLGAFMADFIQVADRLEGRARDGYDRLGLDFNAESPRDGQTLSPSDFGFHNALRRPSGALTFLDFEYFGWDDPVKLTADFVLHPGMALEPALCERFTLGAKRLFGDIPTFAERLDLLTPLFGLRWCMIILNEFLPERWARRAYAGAGDQAVAEARQLAKAQNLLSSLLDGNMDHDR